MDLLTYPNSFGSEHRILKSRPRRIQYICDLSLSCGVLEVRQGCRSKNVVYPCVKPIPVKGPPAFGLSALKASENLIVPQHGKVARYEFLLCILNIVPIWVEFQCSNFIVISTEHPQYRDRTCCWNLSLSTMRALCQGCQR